MSLQELWLLILFAIFPNIELVLLYLPEVIHNPDASTTKNSGKMLIYFLQNFLQNDEDSYNKCAWTRKCGIKEPLAVM
jgi:hypothetical protein